MTTSNRSRNTPAQQRKLWDKIYRLAEEIALGQETETTMFWLENSCSLMDTDPEIQIRRAKFNLGIDADA